METPEKNSTVTIPLSYFLQLRELFERFQKEAPIHIYLHQTGIEFFSSDNALKVLVEEIQMLNNQITELQTKIKK